VLGTENAQAILEQLERSNVFLKGLDETRDWYRYHHLFGQKLQADLARSKPELSDDLHRRASSWFEAAGRSEEAINHAIAGHDVSAASTLMAERWPSIFEMGTMETVQGWLDQMGPDAVEADAVAAVTAAWVAALSAEPERMEYFLGLAERGAGQVSRPRWIEGRIAVIRGLFRYSRLEDRHSQLVHAQSLEPPVSLWRSFISWGLGHVSLMSGDAVAAASHFQDVSREPISAQPVLAMITAAEHAVAEMEVGNLASAERKARKALAVVEEQDLKDDPRSSAALIALYRVAVARGDLTSGRQWLEGALRVRGRAARRSPWPTLEVLLALTPMRNQLRMAAVTEGSTERGDVSEDTRALPPGTGSSPVATVRPGAANGWTDPTLREVDYGERLTERELVILRMLESHLTAREIGDELYLSINTVKTHTRSIYRKLGVSSRRSALERAGGLQLI
jgi:LuxR family maltose regulon positive regulatory protein